MQKVYMINCHQKKDKQLLNILQISVAVPEKEVEIQI